ncbi:DUF1800 family protein [Micromonospora sp. WMMC415]|uniref:DUF1800 domain-containing protein n=1 Tax=Micromonospora sp. WMMC415 TaxID=2675222 RepID=UPI0012B4535A|nr:DUF1800 domain-containing protein [Micromonospora sp. WMMC415]QGN50406.1 DUF1800 family protein [Micromonospora sp. WMMC415]
MSDSIGLLLWRAGFGATAVELAAARQAGYDAALSAVVAPPGPDVGATRAPVPDLGPDAYAGKRDLTYEEKVRLESLRTAQTEQLTQWWLDRMTVASHQAVEKLVFFWHGHWATSVKKVRSPQLMLKQHRTLRTAPDFRTMARLMVVDAALNHYLDGQLNIRDAPNENLARELFELFTLGIGHYSEKDVKEAGRALTGWRFSLTKGASVFDPGAHDGGSKTILGRTGAFTASSLVELLLEQPACPRFIASRLWFRYGSSATPVPQQLMEKMAQAFPAPMAMLRVLFEDEAFRATAGSMVKQPVEWLVGAMRQLGLRFAGLPAETRAAVVRDLESLGQLPFAPPNVGGWPAGGAWLTSAAAQVRLRLAGRLVDHVSVGTLTPESVAYLLCVERWTNRTYAVLRGAQDRRQLLILGLVSPEYLLT